MQIFEYEILYILRIKNFKHNDIIIFFLFLLISISFVFLLFTNSTDYGHPMKA